MWAKSPVARQILQTRLRRTGQTTRPELFFKVWLPYWSSDSPLDWQNLQIVTVVARFILQLSVASGSEQEQTWIG